MEIIDNINRLLGEDLKRTITPGVKLKIAAASFSIYAFEALKEQLEQVESLEFIFTLPTFVPGEVRIKTETPLTASDLDIGFRVLKADSSNMSDVYYSPDAVSQDLLSGQVGNIREDRTGEDLLFQVLLDWGVDLSLPICRETIFDKDVLSVDGGVLMACFDSGISEDFVKQLAARKPLRVVFRDSGFANDSVKINVDQIFKLLSPATEIKTI